MMQIPENQHTNTSFEHNPNTPSQHSNEDQRIVQLSKENLQQDSPPKTRTFVIRPQRSLISDPMNKQELVYKADDVYGHFEMEIPKHTSVDCAQEPCLYHLLLLQEEQDKY